MNPSDGGNGLAGITTRLSLAATLESRALLDAVPDAILVVNQEGTILQINAQTESMFGYRRGELVGQCIEMLLPTKQRELHCQHRKQFTEQPMARPMGPGLDLRAIRHDGSEFSVEISLSPVSTADGIVVVSAIRDVTGRKHIENELRRATEVLAANSDRQLR